MLLISSTVKLGSCIEQLKSSVEGVGVREPAVREKDGKVSVPETQIGRGQEGQCQGGAFRSWAGGWTSGEGQFVSTYQSIAGDW